MRVDNEDNLKVQSRLSRLKSLAWRRMMTQTWQLQEAKNKLSKLVDDALVQGPQIITRRGVEVVIVIAYDQYKKMTVSDQKLSDFFRSSPLANEELDLTGDKSAIREELTL